MGGSCGSPAKPFALPFTIRSGEATYIGSFMLAFAGNAATARPWRISFSLWLIDRIATVRFGRLPARGQASQSRSDRCFAVWEPGAQNCSAGALNIDQRELRALNPTASA